MYYFCIGPNDNGCEGNYALCEYGSNDWGKTSYSGGLNSIAMCVDMSSSSPPDTRQYLYALPQPASPVQPQSSEQQFRSANEGQTSSTTEEQRPSTTEGQYSATAEEQHPTSLSSTSSSQDASSPSELPRQRRHWDHLHEHTKRGLSLPQTLPGSWTSSGCYTDNVNFRTLASGAWLSLDNMTAAACIEFCDGNGFTVAGTEYTRECFCGFSLAPGSRTVDAAECYMPCTGNSAEPCGGPNRLNVFHHPITSHIITPNEEIVVWFPCTPKDGMGSGCKAVYGSASGWRLERVSDAVGW